MGEATDPVTVDQAVFSTPDDPYIVGIGRNANGDWIVSVSADALGESPEVQAECRRRAEAIVGQLTAMVRRMSDG